MAQTNRRHLALKLLRVRQGWDQKDLARAAGMRPNYLSDLEMGDRTLSQERLEYLLGLMGLAPLAIEAAYAFMDATDSTAGVETGWLARKAGQAMEHFMREAEALCSAGLRAIADRNEAQALWARLSAYNEAQRRTIAQKSREFRTWALCELICAESIKAAADDAARALALADLARTMAELIPGEAAWRSRVQGYCWAHVANSHRVQGQLKEADRAFARANELWLAGAVGDPGLRLEEARMLDLEASLRRQQRRLPEALELLTHALEVNVRQSLVPSLLVNLANVEKLQGDYEVAIATLQRVDFLLTGTEEPRLRWLQRFTLADCLCHTGQASQSEALVPELRRLAIELGNELDSLRLRWLEARISAGLGRREAAIVALARVRQELADLSIPYDVALATLELAVLYLEQGRTAEVKTLAHEMRPIFEAQGVQPEAIAALRLFTATAEREKVTALWAQSLVRFFYRAQGDPNLRFVPPS